MVSIREIKHIDYLLLFAALTLLAGGWFVMYSASLEERLSTGIDYPHKQLVWMFIALAAFFIMLLVDYHFFLKISFIIYILVILLLLLVLILGGERFGAKRWIGLGGFTLQPSEVAKLGVIITIVRYLVWDIENREKFRYLLFTGIILFIPLLLIFKQPDLGTTLVFIPTVFVMLFASGLLWRYIAGSLAIGAASMPALWSFLKVYQKKRIISFLDPESDPFGSGYSLIQSKIAIGSGGLFGKGWLGGTQNRLNFIPERHTDFIFSVVGEEWGFIGALVVLVLFFILIASGFNIVHKSPDLSGKFLSLGIVTILTIQIVINIGMTIGIVPVTGIPLPFISYGGTSLVVTMAMIGLLENIHMRRFMF